LEKEKSDRLITEAAKSIFTYCRSRTSLKEDAEDLTQDILLELLKTRDNLRDDRAFYGFMWAVAGNIYKNWCKKHKRYAEIELSESIADKSAPFTELLDKEENIRLLYRELSLLSAQYRKVAILYYFDGLKVSEISKAIGITQSMVKFLLFKSRKILKEGMNMERTRGNLSFNPSGLGLAVLANRGNFRPEDWDYIHTLCEDNLLAQNILLSCYNDRCTADEISLQIGVAIPYLERDLKKLCEKGLLTQKSGKYETAIVIFTKEFAEEAYEKTLQDQREIAEAINKYFNEHFNEINSIVFHVDENCNLFKWLITRIILAESLSKYNLSLNMPAYKNYAGIEAHIWGLEVYPNAPGRILNMWRENTNGDSIHFMDFFENSGEPDCFFFDRYQNRVNIVLDIARAQCAGFNENDKTEIAELIRNGFVSKSGEELSLKLQVFTEAQYKEVLALLKPAINDIIDKIQNIINTFVDILVQHTPVSMKKEVEKTVSYKAADCVLVPIKIMLDNDMLYRALEHEHPTTFVILK